jgi:tyrosyl-tRNA synthetase
MHKSSRHVTGIFIKRQVFLSRFNAEWVLFPPGLPKIVKNILNSADVISKARFYGTIVHMKAISEEKIQSILNRNVEQVIDAKHLEVALRSGKRLRVKLGIDPTSPDLHLGHAVVLKKLREFQDLGHKAVLIIGDFTAQIGDPTGRDKTRPPLSPGEIKENLKKYVAQAGKIIDVKKTEIRHNSEWLGTLKGAGMLQLLGMMSVQQIMEREDFQKRFSEHTTIRLHELIYPIMQGYDSVSVKADIELGGTDQTFNLLVGRDLMEKHAMKPQDILTVPLLVGLDGERKMSKSYGNYIGLTDKPQDMFGKAMSIPDAAMGTYFMFCTDLSREEIGTLEKECSPRDRKVRLAFEIVKTYHGEKTAKKAQDDFEKIYVKKDLSGIKIPEIYVPDAIPMIDLIILCFREIGIEKSRGEARRLILEGGLQIDGEAWKDPKAIFKTQTEVIRIASSGRHRFKLIPEWSR